MEPIITVAIPTYNGEPWIKQCLDSVLAQTRQDFCILISDDGSQDKTISIIKEYAENDPRITIQYNNHKKRNYFSLIENCNTPYLKILCQDDWLLPDCLEKQLFLLENDPKLGLVTSPYILCFGDKISKMKVQRISSGHHSPNKKLFRRLMLECNVIGPPAAVTFRSDVIKSFDYDDYIRYLCELVFYFDAFKKGYNFFVTDSPQVVYRIQPNMNTFTNKYTESIIDYYKKLITRDGALGGMQFDFQTKIRLHYWQTRRMLSKIICKFLLKI